MEKKIPQRTCVACRRTVNKSDLVRVVRTPEGETVVDVTGKRNGRGAYVCARRECVEKCRKSKALERALDCKVTDSVYDELLGACGE